MFVVYRQKGPEFGRTQIGYVSLSEGQVRPISRDTNSYSTLSLSGDGKTLATVQQKEVGNLFIVPGQGSASPTANPLVVDGEHVSGFTWTADGALLTTDYTRLLHTDADGKNPTALVSDPAAGILHPSVCGAQYIVFPWAFRGGTNSIGIWRLNADGSHPTQLTDGGNDGWRSAACSGNQGWVYFFRDVTNVWRVPLDGSGKPEAIAASAITGAFQTGRGMGISPDGKTLAYLVEFVNLSDGMGTARIALLDLGALGSGTVSAPRLLDVNPHISLGPQFTIDGKAVSYPIRENGRDNIWIQNLDGSAGHAITNFDSEQILSFHWSPDGKNLGILRGHTDSDVVLLQESKP
jgi:Tol biopolymer transport system component